MTDDPIFKYQDLITAQFPDYADWSIECLSIEIQELDVTSAEFRSRVDNLENDDGYFPEAALEQALEEQVLHLQPPNGHMFVRVVKEGEPSTLLLLRVA